MAAAFLVVVGAASLALAVALLLGRKKAAAEMSTWSPFVRKAIANGQMSTDHAIVATMRFSVYPLVVFLVVFGLAFVAGGVGAL